MYIYHTCVLVLVVLLYGTSVLLWPFESVQQLLDLLRDSALPARGTAQDGLGPRHHGGTAAPALHHPQGALVVGWVWAWSRCLGGSGRRGWSRLLRVCVCVCVCVRVRPYERERSVLSKCVEGVIFARKRSDYESVSL